MKNKKYVIAGIALFALVMLGGGLFMNKNSGDWSERHREDIEENVRNYVERYKLDPDKVEIVSITEPIKYPTGEEDFGINIEYYGEPYFSMVLTADPNNFFISDEKELITKNIFNELYLQARYEELSPAIDYLNSIGLEDPLRPAGESIKFFRTNVGINPQINDEIREAYKSGEDFEELKSYIETHLDKIIRLDTNMKIIGRKEGIGEVEAAKIEEELKTLLPQLPFRVEIGVRDLATGESEGLYKTIEAP
ncbi:hypothetical protein HXZ66_18835 [Bacillus sp. A116_S68]|nr:hypothetical protein HXZ66_18835 [Bacillus sp. A116_S68]